MSEVIKGNKLRIEMLTYKKAKKIFEAMHDCIFDDLGSFTEWYNVNLDETVELWDLLEQTIEDLKEKEND